MRIGIIGLGGVGGYIGAYLSKSSHDVVCFGRGEHLESIKNNGIKIIEEVQLGDIKRWSTPLDARDLSQADGYFDIVMFCVKSYDLRSSYEGIKPFIDSKSTLLSFSNGVDNGDILREISDSIVLDACIYILSHIEQNGVIRKKGKVFSAVFGGDENSSKVLKSIFEETGLRVKVPDDIKKAIYKKFIFISAFASLTTYYDESIAQVCESHLFESKMLLNEIANVAMSQGIDILDEVDKSLDIARSLPYDASTSMHLDYKQGKKMELASLCGYVVKEGDKNLVDTPFMKTIYTSLVQ